MINKIFKYIIDHQVILVIFLISLVWFIIKIKFTLAIFFIAYLIMVGISPLVYYLEKRGLPKFAAIGLPYLAIPLLLAVLIIVYLPGLQSQIDQFVGVLPKIIDSLDNFLHIHISSSEWISALLSFFNSSSGSIVSLAGLASEIILGLIAVFAVSIYLIIYKKSLYRSAAGLFAPKEKESVYRIINEIEKDLGKWVQGQVIVSLSVGFAVFVLLIIVGLPFSLVLAILAALLEVIPYAGPVISAVPAIIVAASISSSEVIAVIIGYIAVHQIENHILVPNIINKKVGLSPLLVIASVLIGAELWGVLGALIAVPIATLIQSAAKSFKKE